MMTRTSFESLFCSLLSYDVPFAHHILKRTLRTPQCEATDEEGFCCIHFDAASPEEWKVVRTRPSAHHDVEAESVREALSSILSAELSELLGEDSLPLHGDEGGEEVRLFLSPRRADQVRRLARASSPPRPVLFRNRVPLRRGCLWAVPVRLEDQSSLLSVYEEMRDREAREQCASLERGGTRFGLTRHEWLERARRESEARLAALEEGLR